MIIQQRVEVIASKNAVIIKEIGKYLSDHSVELTHVKEDYKKKLNSLVKIDLLVVDADIYTDFSSYRIKTIINLVNKDTRNSKFGICLEVPIKLNDLLFMIKNDRTREQLFCAINANWIYDERLRQISKSGMQIIFTEKENEVFKYLILSPDNTAHKNHLLDIVWHYHIDINSTTVESHMSRLKQKLPDNSIKCEGNYYKLILDNIS